MASDKKTKSPTPARGIGKGLLIIAFGFVLGLAAGLMVISGDLDYTSPESLLVGLAVFLVIFGLALWRGITAIVRRKKKRVSIITLVIWVLLVLAALLGLFWLI